MILADTKDVEPIIESLEQELVILEKLLRLSHRQQRYLIRNDLRRVRQVLEPQQECVQRARALRTGRVRSIEMLGLDDTPGKSPLKSLAEVADDQYRERVERAAKALARATERLGRKNAQNHQIARFSLDLVGEEMRLLLGAAERSSKAYDAGGVVAGGILSGAVDGRA